MPTVYTCALGMADIDSVAQDLPAMHFAEFSGVAELASYCLQ
jgi:hypothetical protein